MIPDKIYHFLGYDSMGMMIEQERKHWLMKTDRQKRLQDKKTGDVFQGKIDNLGSDVIIESSKLPIKVVTNEAFQWKENLNMDYIVNVEKSTFTHSSAVNGLMFLRITSISYPLNVSDETIHHYRVQFNDCEECLIPFGGSMETDDVYVGKWIKTTTPPVLQVMNDQGVYTTNLNMEFIDDITHVTFYYPLDENLQTLDLTQIDESTYVTSGVTDNQYIGYPLMWFTADQSTMGPSIKIGNNSSEHGKQLMLVGNAGNESKYHAHLYVNVDGNQNATPDDTPVSGWYVICKPVVGQTFSDNSSDYYVSLDPSSIALNDELLNIEVDGDSKIRMTPNDDWEYIDATTYRIPMTSFELNCLESSETENALSAVFDVFLDESIPFTQTTKDAGYAGIRATASNDYSDIQTRYPYNLNKWTGLPKWIQDSSDDDAVGQHTIVYALHNTQSSIEGSPETLQTAALILDPGKRREEDPEYNKEQYERSLDFVNFVLENPPTEAEAKEIRSKYSLPDFDTTRWTYTNRVLNKFKELRSYEQFQENPACCSTEYVWHNQSADYINSHIPHDLTPQEMRTMYDEWMIGLLNNSAYHVITDDYIHDTTGIDLMRMYDRYHEYTDFIDKHPMSQYEKDEINEIYKTYGKFPIITRGDIDDNGVVDEEDLATLRLIFATDGELTISDSKGDVNLDGQVFAYRSDDNSHPDSDQVDDGYLLRKYLRHMVTLTEQQKANADISEDDPGTLSLSDVVAIRRLVEANNWQPIICTPQEKTFDISLSKLEKIAADMNNDGEITEEDMTLLEEYITALRNGTARPQWYTIDCEYVKRVMDDFKKLIPMSLFEQLPNHYTADYIWNDKETSYSTEGYLAFHDAMVRNLWECVLTQLIQVTAYRMITDNYIHDMSDIYNNNERGRVYVLSNDSIEYKNNGTAAPEDIKPARTVARICDIPTSAMQLTGVTGLSPTQVVDKQYVRQETSYTLEDKDKLYNQMASRWVRPNALTTAGSPVSTDNRYVFNSLEELNRVDLFYHNDFRYTKNLSPRVPPNKVRVANIYSPGSGYAYGDVGILMIGGYAFSYQVSIVDEGGGVRNVDIIPNLSSDYEIHLSNFDLQNPDDYTGLTVDYGTSPTTGHGTGLRLRLQIEDFALYMPEKGEVFEDLYAFVSEDNGIWIYSYIIDPDTISIPKTGSWQRCDQLTKFEKSNYNINGAVTSSDTLMTTVLPQRRQITIPQKSTNSTYYPTTTIDTLTTASFINIIDTQNVPYDISNVVQDNGVSKQEVDLCGWRCSGLTTLTAKSKTVDAIIDEMDRQGLLREQCHIFFKFLDESDDGNKRFECGVIYQVFNNYRSTDTKTFLPENDFRWKKYITSNANTTVVWNTDEMGVMMWIYDPSYHVHEKYAIDIDSKDLTITRKSPVWAEFVINKTDNTGSVTLVDSYGNFNFHVWSNCFGYSHSPISDNSATLHTQYNFVKIGERGKSVGTATIPYVCAGNWRLVYPRLHSFTFRNDQRGISYNAIEMQTIMAGDMSNPGDIINDQSGFQVNQKTLLVNNGSDGMELRMFNNETSTWDKV